MGKDFLMETPHIVANFRQCHDMENDAGKGQLFPDFLKFLLTEGGILCIISVVCPAFAGCPNVYCDG